MPSCKTPKACKDRALKAGNQHPQLRQRLIEQARCHGVRDESVLTAIGQVPREHFVPESLKDEAFDDGPLPIGSGQTISQPAMVALMAEAARLSPDDRVLEIGAGSGYGAAVLRTLSKRVVTVERLISLAKTAQASLTRSGYGDVSVVIGDGTLGWPSEAPYDAIVVTAAGPNVPQPLVDQLEVGGRLVMPVGAHHQNQRLMRYTRRSHTRRSPKVRHVNQSGAQPSDLHEEPLMPVRFVPLIGAHGWSA